jgi:hypothetical protein
VTPKIALAIARINLGISVGRFAIVVVASSAVVRFRQTEFGTQKRADQNADMNIALPQSAIMSAFVELGQRFALVAEIKE